MLSHIVLTTPWDKQSWNDSSLPDQEYKAYRGEEPKDVDATSCTSVLRAITLPPGCVCFSYVIMMTYTLPATVTNPTAGGSLNVDHQSGHEKR